MVADIQKLAALARIEISPEDAGRFAKEFDAILAYISQLEKLGLDSGGRPETPRLHNVMREDGEPHETGFYTKQLTEQFPAREGDYLVVKQVISHE